MFDRQLIIYSLWSQKVKRESSPVYESDNGSTSSLIAAHAKLTFLFWETFRIVLNWLLCASETAHQTFSNAYGKKQNTDRVFQTTTAA